jgi:hypothetical protein
VVSSIPPVDNISWTLRNVSWWWSRARTNGLRNEVSAMTAAREIILCRRWGVEFAMAIRSGRKRGKTTEYGCMRGISERKYWR